MKPAPELNQLFLWKEREFFLREVVIGTVPYLVESIPLGRPETSSLVVASNLNFCWVGGDWFRTRGYEAPQNCG